MRLFYRSADNGRIEPWLIENDWTVQLDLDWSSWLFGFSYRHRFLVISFGPLVFGWWRNS